MTTQNLSLTEGSSQALQVAAFSDSQSGTVASSYTATMQWGDGATTPAQVEGSNGNFTVMGSHEWVDAGNYQTVVTVTGPSGSATSDSTATVAPVAPTVAISGPSQFAVNAPFTLNLSAIYVGDPDGDTIAGWSINWGDGTSSALGGSATTATHQYAATGQSYVVSAIASDDDGSYGSNNLLVNQIPLAPGNLTAFGAQYNSVILAWNGSSGSYVNGYAIEQSSGAGFSQIGAAQASQSQFVVDNLAPGTTYNFMVEAFDAAGNSSPSNSTTITTAAAPIPAAPMNVSATISGTDAATLRWTDLSPSVQGYAIEEATNGGNFFPLASAGSTSESYLITGLAAGSSYSFDVAAFNQFGESAFSTAAEVSVPAPPNAITLSAPAYSAYANGTLTISAPNGLLQGASDTTSSALTAALVGTPERGSVTVNPDGSFTFYAPNSVGPDSFSYTVSDVQGNQATGIATINVLSTGAPTVTNPSYTVAADSTLSVSNALQGVLAGAVDPGNLPLTVTVSGQPSSGVLTLAPNGTFTYTPHSGFVGTDSFGFEVSDGTNSPSYGTASINVVNTPPIVESPSYAAPAGQVLTIAASEGLLAGATDTDGDPLAIIPYSATTYYGGQINVSSNGAFTYTPAAGFSGTDTTAFSVTDGVSTIVATATFNVVADAPTAGNYTFDLAEGSTLNIGAGVGLLANGTGTPNDPWQVNGGNTLTESTAHGTVTINGDGSFVYTAASGYVGSDSFTYYVSSPTANSATATVTLNVIGQSLLADSQNYVVAPGGTLTVSSAQGLLAGAIDPTPGTTLTAELVGSAMMGQLTLNPDGSFTYTPYGSFVTSDSFTYAITNGALTSNTATVLIAVAQASPIGQPLYYSVQHGQTLSENAAQGVLASDVSPSGGALSAQLDSGPAHGSLQLNADGSFSYTPYGGFAGNDSFTYSASDGDTISAPITVDITIENSPPAATGQTYSVYENATLNASPGLLTTASDPDGDPLTLSLIQGTQNGTLTLNANGTFSYIPDSGFTGADTFTYEVSDGIAATTAVTTINVLPIDLPPTTSAPSYSTQEGQPLSVALDNLLTYATDPQGLPMAVNLVASTTDGALSLNPNGTFTYTPTPGFVGSDQFAYTVSDGVNGANPSAITYATINVTQPPPPTAANSAVNIISGAMLNVPANSGLLSLATDPGNYPLKAAPVTNPTSGTLILNADGSYTYTPNAGFVGTDSFSYSISDSSGTSNVAVVTINVLAGPLVTNSITYQTGLNQALAVGAPMGVLRADWSTDGSSLTAQLDAQPGSGSVALNTDGSFTYTPVTGFVGTTSFAYFAKNSSGLLSSPVTVSIIVADAAPVAADLSFSVTHDQTLNVSSQQGLLSTAYDISGAPLGVFSAGTIGTSHGTVALSVDGAFTYTPDPGYVGSDSFSYAVSDGATTSASATVTINVTNSVPTGTTQSYQLLHDQTLTGNVLNGAIDPDGDSLTAQIYSTVAHGTLNLNSNGSFTYTPAAGYVGPDSFSYAINDGAQSSAPIAVAIDVYNQLPTITSQAYTLDIAQSGSLVENVLTGVTDPDGDTISASLSNGYNNYVIASESTAHGTVTMSANGQFAYTPNAGYVGPDGFSYTALDSAGAATPASVAINVTNSLPLSVNEFVTTGGTNTASGNVLTLPLEQSGSTLSLTAAFASSGFGFFPPGYGGSGGYGPGGYGGGGASTEKTTAGGTASLSSDGQFTYTSPAGFVGTDSFEYTLSSGAATSAPAVVTIDVNPKPPATATATFTNTPGQAINGNVFSTAPAGQSLHVVSVNGTPLSGSAPLILSGGSLQISASGAFTFTPDQGFNGSDSFSYVAANAYLSSQTTTVAIDYNGSAIQTTPAVLTTKEGTSTSGNLLSNVSVVGPQLPLTLVSINGTVVSGSTAVVTNAGSLTVSPSGSFSYQPNSGFYGTDSFAYAVSDGQSETSGVVSINVTAAPPKGSPLTESATEGQPLAIAFSALTQNATDSNIGGGTLVPQIVQGPSNGSVGTSGTAWVYTSNAGFFGRDEFTYSLTDALGLISSPILVTINVAPAANSQVPNIPVATLENKPVTADLANFFNAAWVTANASTLSVKILTAPAHGTATTSAASITYTPNNNYYSTLSAPTDTLSYQLSDSKGDTAEGSLTISVAQQLGAPILPVVSLSGAENYQSQYSLNPAMTDSAGQGVEIAYVRITTQPSNGYAYAVGTTLYYIPKFGFTGNDTFEYKAYTSSWQSASQTASVQVNPVTPSILPAPAPTPLPPYTGTIPPDELNGQADSGQSQFSLAGGGGISYFTGSDIIDVIAQASFANDSSPAPVVSVNIEGENVYASVADGAQNVTLSVSDIPISGGVPAATLYFSGSAENVNLTCTGNVASYAASGNLNVFAGGYIGQMTASGNISAVAGEQVGALNSTGGYVNVSSRAGIASVKAVSSSEIWALGGNIGSIDLTGSLATTNNSAGYQTVRASGNIGPITIGGQVLGNILAAGNITGAVQCGSIAGYVRANGNISGGVSSTGAITGAIYVGGTINGDISSGGYIRMIAGVDQSAALDCNVTAGSSIGYIERLGSINGNITAPNGVTLISTYGAINSQIDSASGYISSISAGGNIGGSISAQTAGTIVSSGGDISANIDLSSFKGLRAAGDLSGSVHASTGNYIDIGRDISSSVSITGAMGGGSAINIGRDLTAAANLQVQSIAAMAVGRDLAGKFETAGSLQSILIGETLSGSINVGGSVTTGISVGFNTFEYNPFSDGQITSANITVAGSLAALTESNAPGFTGLVSASTIYVGGAIQNITIDGAMTNSNITAVGSVGNSGSITIGNGVGVGYGGDMSGSVTSSAGGISGVDVTNGSMNANLTAGLAVGMITALDNIGGNVTSQNQNIVGVSAGQSVTGNITAHTNIGENLSPTILGVLAGDNITGNLTATLGDIVVVTAGTAVGGEISGNISAGGYIGAITADASVRINTAVDPSVSTPTSWLSELTASTPGQTPPAPAPPIMPAPPTASLGYINSTISALGSIASITAAGGIISGIVSAGTTLGPVWSLGDMQANISAKEGGITVNAWGQLSGNVTAAQQIVDASFGDMTGSLTSSSGSISASSWGNLSSKITAPISVALTAVAGIAASVTAANLTEISWAAAAGNFTEQADGGTSTTPNSPSPAAQTGGTLLVESVGNNNVQVSASGNLNALSYVVMLTFGTLNLSPVTIGATTFDFSLGGITLSGSVNAQNADFVTAGNFSGTINATGSVDVNAMGSADVTISSAGYGQPQTVNVSGSSVSGTISGQNVYVDSAGEMSATINGSYGANAAQQNIVVRAGGNISGNITGTGKVDVVTAGDLSANLTSAGNISVTAWGSSQGQILSSAGAIGVLVGGTLGGTITGHDFVAVQSFGTISANISTTGSAGSAGGYVNVFSATDWTAANVSAQGDVAIKVLGSLGGTITAGAGSYSGTEFNAAIDASGDVSATIQSSGSVSVSTLGSVTSGARITASAGYATIQAGSAFQAAVAAQSDISVLAATINDSNQITSSQGGVTLQSLGALTATEVTAASSAVLDSGTNSSSASAGASGGAPLMANVTITDTSGGYVNLNSLGDISSGTTVTAPGATVVASAGGNANFAVTGASGNYAASIGVTAEGTLNGTFDAMNSINAFSHGALDATFTAAAPSSGGYIGLFSDGAMTATATSSGSISAGTMATLTGTFNAGTAPGGAAPAQAPGSVTLSAVGDIGPTTVNAYSYASVATDGTLTNANINVGSGLAASAPATDEFGGANISANELIASLTVNTRDITSISSNFASVDGTFNIDQGNFTNPYIQNTAYAATGFDSKTTITSGGDLTVSTPEATAAAINVTQSAVVSALGDASGAVTAGGTVSESADNVSGNVTAGTSASVYGAGNISGNITAQGGAADVSSLGTISGTTLASDGAYVYATSNLTGQVTTDTGNATVTVGGYISAAVQAGSTDGTATSSAAAVTAIGNISAPVSASGYASVSTFGNLTAAVTAGTNATVSASGYINAQITASAGYASVTTLGTLQGGVNAGTSANVSALGNIGAPVNAGQNAIVSSLTADITGNVTASAGYASLTAQGAVTNTTDAGTNVSISNGGYISATVQAGASANITSGGQTQLQLTAAQNAVITAGGQLSGTITASAGYLSLAATGNINAQLQAGTQITINAMAQLAGAANSSNGSISATAAGAMSMNLTAGGSQWVQVTALDGIVSGTISAGGYVNIMAANQLDATIEAGQGASIITSGTFTGSATGGAGSLSLLAGGAIDITGQISANSITIATLGSLTTGPGGDITGQSVQVIAGQSVAAAISGTNVTLTTLGADASTITATQSLQVQAQGTISGLYTSGGTLNLTSWAGIAPSTRAVASDIAQVWSLGPIAGNFTGTLNIGSIQSYSSIDATIDSGNHQTGLPPGDGNFQSLEAWGAISGTITAAGSISEIMTASSFTASISTGSAGSVGSLIANDRALTAAMVPVSPLSIAAVQAAMNAFSNSLAAAAQQATASAAAATASMASIQSLVNQESSQAQAGNRIALSAAQGQIAAGSSIGAAQTATVGQQVLTAQSQGAQQTAAAKANGQGQDQQLNQQLVDQLATAQQQVSSQQANLQAGITASELAVANIQSLGQQEISKNIAQLAKDNSNRDANWAADANGLIEQVLVHPLQVGLNYVAAGAAFLAVIPVLDVPMAVVAGAASLLNAGISALEGHYMSSGMYAVMGLIPMAGTIADIGEMADGSDAALAEAIPQVEAAVNDAGQETSNVLAADGVESRCVEGSGNCFLAGTQVITAVNSSGGYSTEAIQNITVGQTVLTKNQNDPNGPLQQETVTAVQVHTVYSLRDVTIKNADGTTETIDTTDSHPFYIQGQGWVSADDLLAGETLSTPDGQTATVVGTISVAEPVGVRVYNFTVADDHTYFVEGFGGASGVTGSAGTSAPLDAVWVHNDCNPLLKNLLDSGVPKAAGQEAHHIVAQGAMNPDAVAARAILKEAGIDIHEPINGVFLDDSAHARLHTKLYYETVAQRLSNANVADGAAGVERELLNIANELKAGTFPY